MDTRQNTVDRNKSDTSKAVVTQRLALEVFLCLTLGTTVCSRNEGDEYREIQLGVIEAKYADMIWEHEPVTSSELVKMTATEFNWKRTTAHNVLRRLIDKGLFQNEKGVVTSVISREDFYAKQSREYVETSFEGSLPAFVAAFTRNKKLTQEEADAIRQMIDQAEER